MTITTIGRDRIEARVENVKKCLFFYHNTLEFIENIDLEMESWICLQLFIGLPKTVMYTYKAMKTVLNEVLLMEIQRTLNYMKFRPMKCSIWRMFPLNATLPLKFVSLCVTYIIVSAQFTSLM
ncbi:uncharacterized protein LOC135193883 [Vanessa tameamea]|uniref:Uncharacterized protein LOC135193883 n=1 Tax=Vanessa tameamea TaxID=334116 RepID=A0ABM4ASD4_VANTA